MWNNTTMNAYDRKVRNIISWSLTIGLIIGAFYVMNSLVWVIFLDTQVWALRKLVWAIPVAFVGVISNIDSLCHTVKFLSWLCKIPGGTSLSELAFL